jgi:sulfite reductase (ferredoxin)
VPQSESTPAVASPPAKPSPAEELKRASNHLRGTIAAELANENAAVSKPASALLKFHGAYQQDDRDRRKQEPVKSYSFMVRVSLPGGIIAPRQYLALDALADTAGDGTLRITSRGGLQYHYVGKRTLRDCIRAINGSGLSTFAACGDVVRNVVAPAEPFETPQRQRLDEYARLLNRSFKPHTRAYAEIWLDGAPAATLESESEPLYGDAYLPRKFKFGFAVEGDNTTDIYIHDCGFVAHFEGRALLGFTALAGGGMGQSNGIPGTYRRLADVATAAVSIHRDFSDRVNRKRARLKYVIQDRGIEWFAAEMARRLGHPLAPPRELKWQRHEDYFGWHEQSPGVWFCGLRVVSGRLGTAQRAALREAVQTLAPEIRFTPQQNLLLCGLSAAARPLLEIILRRHSFALPSQLPPVLLHSMACPALPTCGLALAESERVLPDLAARVQSELDAAGAAGETVVLRMTGCPNGCSRPYTAEIGIVGQSPGLYSIYLGGSPLGTRLAQLYSHNIRFERISSTLAPLFGAWVAQRQPGEAFGDYCGRAGLEHLRARHLTAPVEV